MKVWPKWKDPYDGSEIHQNGSVFVSKSGNIYPIEDGIPRFVKHLNYSQAFGKQWNHYQVTQLDSYTGEPISEKRLKLCLGEDLFKIIKSTIILDAGCGAGRFTEIFLKYNANVMSIDMSEAIETNQRNFPQNNNHRIAQADILNLPFAKRKFDLVICLGVVQHTPSSEKTIYALYDQVKPGGTVVFDHYVYSFSHYTHILRLFLRPILKRLSPDKGLRITELLTDIFLPLHKIGRRSYLWQLIMKLITPVTSYYYDYPELSDELQKEWALLDTHDALTDYYKHFKTRGQIFQIMNKLGMKNIICEYGSTGIRARGMRPDY